MNFSGLRSINRRDGFGSDFVAVLHSNEDPNQKENPYILDPLAYNYPNGINPNIHQAHYLASTLVAQPKHEVASQSDVLNSPDFKIKSMIHTILKKLILKAKNTHWPQISLHLMVYGCPKII